MADIDDVPRSALDPARLFSCAGQVAVVTGGSSGIGRACAEALAAAEARVLIAALADTDLEDAARRMRELGLDVEGVGVDLAAPGSASTVVAAAVERWGNRVLSCYGMTKAANAQLVRNLAVQWGHAGVRANAISPGVIATDFARPITDDPATATRRLERTPLGRFGRVEEIAGAVVWLASSAGAFTTGQNLVIDRGTLVAD